jgi:hypothetical protein
MLVAQHMLSAKRIVELININGNSFIHVMIILILV